MSKEKKTYIISNVVYGDCYPALWLDNHIKSICDDTNLPALREKYKLEYALFTDEHTLQAISRHPSFMRLGQLCEMHIVTIKWPADANQFASRYGVLAETFHKILEVALQKNAYSSCLVADLVFAKHALPRILKKLENGHDAVFNVPIRSAADSVNVVLNSLPGAPSDMELFELAYANLHHLWVASHWESPLFSKFPYSILWNSGTGLLAHNFGITPIAFKAIDELKNVRGVIDSDVPAMFKNPFWATDWTDAPVAGVEPLSNGHYPPFLQHRSSVEFVAEWATKGTQPCQLNYLDKPLYYPSRKRFNNVDMAKDALAIIT